MPAKPPAAKFAAPRLCDLTPTPEEQATTHPAPAEVYNQANLLRWGVMRADAFCKANRLPAMEVLAVAKGEWNVGPCAYWRASTCKICVSMCARPAGEARSPNWNWPGAVTDRTPYGVVAHELGHHADYHRSGRRYSYGGDYSGKLRRESGERMLTSYCPNDFEWFAEMFRLFVTNHALLALVRPRTWELLVQDFEPVSDYDWMTALGNGAPDRILSSQLRR